jgi:arylsulfatase A-like enzyme
MSIKKLPKHSHVSHREPGWRLLLASVGFGLCSGLIEVAILALRKYGLKANLYLSADFVWMVPITTVVVCLVIGLVTLVTSALPHRVSFRISIFVVALIGFLGPLLAVPRLHFYAALLLAAGLAVQTVRIITAHMESYYALVWPTIQWTAAVVIFLGVGVYGWQIVVERNAVATLPSASPNAANVLLIVLDTVRAESLSLYGYPRPTTPNLERLSKEAVVFGRALSTSPWTLPSHASMFTGHWPHELSADWKIPLDAAHTTLAEVLRAHGYITAGFVGNLIYGSSMHGLNRGFIHYEDFPVSIGQAILSSSLGSKITNNGRLRYWLDYHRVLNRKTAAEVNEKFLNWLSHKRRPFFAFINYMDAHEPYLPPEPFDEKFGPKRQRTEFVHTGIDAFRPAKWKMSPKEVEVESTAYEGVIAYIDHELGALVAELERRGLLESTLVIITSDHGEQLGEHRLFGHGNSLYRQLLEVPLMIRFGTHVPHGKVIEEPVSLRDIPATVIDLLGVDDSGSFPGGSLARYWQESNENRVSEDAVLISESRRRSFGVQTYPLNKGNMISLVGFGYHYITSKGAGDELYDFNTDQAEEQNLVGSENGQWIIEKFKPTLKTVLGPQVRTATTGRVN